MEDKDVRVIGLSDSPMHRRDLLIDTLLVVLVLSAVLGYVLLARMVF